MRRYFALNYNGNYNDTKDGAIEYWPIPDKLQLCNAINGFINSQGGLLPLFDYTSPGASFSGFDSGGNPVSLPGTVVPPGDPIVLGFATWRETLREFFGAQDTKPDDRCDFSTGEKQQMHLKSGVVGLGPKATLQESIPLYLTQLYLTLIVRPDGGLILGINWPLRIVDLLKRYQAGSITDQDVFAALQKLDKMV